MANHERDAKREAFWRGVFQRYAASGLTIRAFCQREQLTESAFFAWRRTITERDTEATSQAGPTRASLRRGGRSPRPAFLPVVLADNNDHDQAIVIELAGGRMLRWPASIDMERLSTFVRALEAGVER
jgi:transposase-like protein